VWILLVVLLMSCQGEKIAKGRLTFRELLTLRDQIAKEFGDTMGDVSVSGDRMIMKFVNSPLSSRGREEKQQRADAVAAFVAAHYAHPVSSVSIHFITAGSAIETGGIYIGRPPRKE